MQQVSNLFFSEKEIFSRKKSPGNIAPPLFCSNFCVKSPFYEVVSQKNLFFTIDGFPKAYLSQLKGWGSWVVLR